MELPHQLSGDGRTSSDASPEGREAGGGNDAVEEEFKFCEEHGRDAVEGSALLFLDSPQGCERVKGFSREDNGRAVGCGGHVA